MDWEELVERRQKQCGRRGILLKAGRESFGSRERLTRLLSRLRHDLILLQQFRTVLGFGDLEHGYAFDWFRRRHGG